MLTTNGSGATPAPNALVAALAARDGSSVLGRLESVRLAHGERLHSARESVAFAYFPVSAVVSLVATMRDGATAEVAIVGREGMIGHCCLFGADTCPYEAVVQVPGVALRLRAATLARTCAAGGVALEVFHDYAMALLVHVSQVAACSALHSVERRLARWLLTVDDRLASSEFPVTQERISAALGTRRAGITAAAGALQKQNLIRLARGRIAIVDRRGLERAACECYEIVRNATDRMVGGAAQLPAPQQQAAPACGVPARAYVLPTI